MGICDKFRKLGKMLNSNKQEQLKDNTCQKQVSGKNSKQYQVGTVVVNQGVSEERVRTIFSEMIPQALCDYTQEAYIIANERADRLGKIVMPRIMQIEGAKEAFLDPSFQVLLRKAQHTAATTERLDDYSLLSELILCHIQKGADRKNSTGISRAIEIVDDIDNDALCALTVAHAVQSFVPISGEIQEGLHVLNDLFEKLLYLELPNGKEWMDHLDILGALRISSFGTLKSIKDYYSQVLNGYICVGIKGDSEDYNKAIDKLKKLKLSLSILQKNELIEGYYRLAIRNKEGIHKLLGNKAGEVRPINENEQRVLEEIWEMYSKDGTLLEKVRTEFIKRWDEFPSLAKVHLWWKKIPSVFEITRVGKVLAHTNAKRCDSNLPDLL